MRLSASKILESRGIETSVPCRLDMGGTLDISTFYYPLAHLNPCTFNIAIDMRTKVCLRPFDEGFVKITSKGFDEIRFCLDSVSFDHPLGLMSAVAAYFQVDGLHIDIESTSPPRSALGGSSSAAVALIGAYHELLKNSGRAVMPYERIPLLAHAIEESTAGVPCGIQDQLAAFYGGINAWFWRGVPGDTPFARQAIGDHSVCRDVNSRILVAYCGAPHESSDINGRWIRQFLSGAFHSQWTDIARYTHLFVSAFSKKEYNEAARLMNLETAVRLELTPDVFDPIGKKLADAAYHLSCGIRFTGAGGGGCVWALGEPDTVARLKDQWGAVISCHDAACLLEVKVDAAGLTCTGDLQRNEKTIA